MTATNQPDRSPAPGTIPEPVHVYHGDALAAATGEQDEPRLKRPNRFRLVAIRVISALRGDKPAVNAHPAGAFALTRTPLGLYSGAQPRVIESSAPEQPDSLVSTLLLCRQDG